MMNKEYAIYLPKGVGKPEIIEFKKEEGLDFYYKTIDCELIDIVNTVIEDYCLVVDDEGLMKPEPEINLRASLLYGYLEHHQPIVGNALICKNKYTNQGTETVGYSYKEAKDLLKLFGIETED